MVEEITFTHVTLKLGDRKRLVVPISYFIEKPFQNWSRESNSLRSSFHLFVDYLTPIDPLREELKKIVEQSAHWDRQAAKLEVSNLLERMVEIRIQISAANADDLSDLRAEVKEKMLRFIREKYSHYLPKTRVSNQTLNQENDHSNSTTN